MKLLNQSWHAFRSIVSEVIGDPELRVLFVLVAIILTIGATVYHLLEGWSWFDSLYFSVTTLATVGFGDFSPKTPFGRVFTIAYIFVGMGLILAFVNAVAHHTRSQLPLAGRQGRE